MRNQLSKKISLIKEKARGLQQKIIFDFTRDGTAVIVANKKTGIVGLIGVEEKEGSMRAFNINVQKWQWARTEGFSKDQMSDRPLRDEIFLPTDMDTLIKNLMGK